MADLNATTLNCYQNVSEIAKPFFTNGDYIQLCILVVLTITAIVARKQLISLKEQLKFNYEWNKKQFALTEVYRTREPIARALSELNPIFKYSERNTDNPITADEIHRAICTYSNDKYELENDQVTKKMNSNGHKIKQNIITVLENYEFIATGINVGIIDEKTVEKILKTPMIRVYKIFEPYIKHLRDHHKRKSVFEELEKVVISFENVSTEKDKLLQ